MHYRRRKLPAGPGRQFPSLPLSGPAKASLLGRPAGAMEWATRLQTWPQILLIANNSKEVFFDNQIRHRALAARSGVFIMPRTFSLWT